MTFASSADLDTLVEGAIQEGRIPGAVLTVGWKGEIVHRRAYGKRAIEPDDEPMTLDTIFDCASLTKVVATASCLMRLYEAGAFRFEDDIRQWIPEFRATEAAITLGDLATHFSGLQPDVPLEPEWRGYGRGIELACTFPPAEKPRVRHIYSDINFELLGEAIGRMSGKTLDEFSHRAVFAPLGMDETSFNPAASLRPRIAPTERDPTTGIPFRGVVHDPTCRYMGGVAGHAGLFSTEADLARFAEEILRPTEFSRLTIALFTAPHTPTDQAVLRGYGWDIDSPYSSPRGDLFPIGSYGHTGFTGTSLWIDPSSESFVILLTNSIHPEAHGGVVELRRAIATATARGLGYG